MSREITAILAGLRLLQAWRQGAIQINDVSFVNDLASDIDSLDQWITDLIEFNPDEQPPLNTQEIQALCETINIGPRLALAPYATVSELLASDADWFTARFLRFMQRCDAQNLARLALVFPEHVAALQRWRRGEPAPHHLQDTDAEPNHSVAT
jgi:hypothetical protein